MLSSTIPSVLALSDFFIKSWPNFWWFPNWYLGNPFQYLSGPIIPSLLLILSKFGFSIQTSYWAVLIISQLIGGVGVWKFVLSIKFQLSRKNEATLNTYYFILTTFLFLFLPLSFLILSFSNGLHQIAWGFVPWIFLKYIDFLSKKSLKNDLILSTLISIALLIDIQIFLPIIVGFMSLIITFKSIFGNKNEKFFSYICFKTLLILLLAFGIATIWYRVGFWSQLLQNPSLGGLPLFNLIKFLLTFSLNLIPILLAFWVVKGLGAKFKNPLQKFTFIFIFTFGLLTIFRFLSDPDFYIDWLGFSLELQFGLAILFTQLSIKFLSSKFKIVLICAVLLLLDGLIVKGWFNPSTTNYQSEIKTLLRGLGQNDRVFLSGTPVFFAKVNQVRGGRDEGAENPFWGIGAYQVRVGKLSDLALNWLKAFGASFILVNDSNSKEPFHDFKNLDRFSSNSDLQLIKSFDGNYLYKINDSTIARLADLSLLKVKPPKDGADVQKLSEYVSKIKNPVSEFKQENNQISLVANLTSTDLISLAITYDPNWKIVAGHGRLFKDSLGNLAIQPNNYSGYFKLVYQPNNWDLLIPIFGSLLILYLIIRYEGIFPIFERLISRLNFGLNSEDF